MKKINSVMFLNGKWKAVTAKELDVFTPGVLKARGVFETMRVSDGKLCAWEQHFGRLNQGLKRLKIPFNSSSTEMFRKCQTGIKKNHLRHGRIRLMVFKKERILNIVILYFDQKPFSASQYQQGFKAIISKIKHPQGSYSSQKTLDYEAFLKAKKEARQYGCDEAILLSSEHKVVEGSISSIFVVKDYQIFTPPLHLGALNGIMRNIVIKTARELGLKVYVKEFSVEFLKNADEVFLTNAVMGVMPLVELNQKKIGAGVTGPITQQVLTQF